MDTNPDVFTIPHELVGSLPRETRITTLGMTKVVLAGVAFALAFGILVWAGSGDLQKAQQRRALRRSGREAFAEVIRLQTHLLDYSFTANGTEHVGEAELPDNERSNVHEGDWISIRYLPGNPAVNHPVAWEWNVFSNFEMLILPVIPLSFGIVAALRLFKQRELLSKGACAGGVVTQCYPFRSHFEVTYEFPAEDGRTYEAHTSQGSRLAIGAKICVLYLPQNPFRNDIYPSGNYRVDH